MEPTNRKISCRAINEHFAAVDISGEVSSLAEDELMAAISEATALGVRAIILNFTHLEYMTSSGIGLLVTLYVRANRGNIRLFAVGLNDHYQRIFELTRLNQSISVYATEEEVLAAAPVIPRDPNGIHNL